MDIVLGPSEIAPQLRAELEQWDRLGDEAWAMIDQWEKQDQ